MTGIVTMLVIIMGIISLFGLIMVIDYMIGPKDDLMNRHPNTITREQIRNAYQNKS